jgi:hypothetical protein
MRALLSVVVVRAAAEAQGIEVVKYGVVIPCHMIVLL